MNTPDAAAVLRTLAYLSPSAEQHATGLTIPLEWFSWLPGRAARLFNPLSRRGPDPVPTVFGVQPGTVAAIPIDRRFGERLAAVDLVRANRHSLAVGWLFVAGRQGKRRVFHPLVTTPVRVSRTLSAAQLVAAGDVEMTSLIEDAHVRNDLEGRVETGRGGLVDFEVSRIPQSTINQLHHVRQFAIEAAEAAGLATTTFAEADADPDALMRREELSIVVGFGVYATHGTPAGSRASSLRDWAEAVEGRSWVWTAFHSTYLDVAGPSIAVREPDAIVMSPFVLTPVQQAAVERSRAEPVTVISGAPGTGKSHTVVAIACDALARGERVLVAAKSDATVDALLYLLDRAPGPDPVVFGADERRDRLAARLAAGQFAPAADVKLDRDYSTMREAVAQAVRRRQRIEDRLGAEQLDSESFEVSEARALAPRLFDPSCDLDAMAAALQAEGWRARRRARRLLGDLPADTVAELLPLARAVRAATELARDGGLELGRAWDELDAAEEAARLAIGRWLDTESRSPRKLNRSTLPAIAALATALRSGRAARREQLRRLDDGQLTQALPLWVGSLPDIDDLLPPIPGLFDLVILDEASSIDQPLAAPALLRARRAVVVGDPNQLRHVSFIADAEAQDAMRQYGIAHHPNLASRLDIRRNSAFDVAVGVAPVLLLDEHFRSNPHLVDFVARRIYGGRVRVATRSPRTESVDCIDIVHTTGHRDKTGVVRAEVDEVIRQLRRLHSKGAKSVGVVTPFRAQADALEAAVLHEFTADEIETLDLRVGTVHAQQGNERDVIVGSLGIGPEDTGSWHFVEDPHLFAVFVTRARAHFTLVVSADPPEGGLLAEYLSHADGPPGPPKSAGPVDSWSEAVAEDLQSTCVRTAYPTGRHVVDVCVDHGPAPVSVECSVHPDGPSAHIDRHLALRRLGWEIVDAYRSKWGDRRGELAVELGRVLRLTPPAPPPSP